MRYITLDKAKPGDILMSDVFDTSGHVMIVAGTELTEKYIERLISMEFGGIYIQDPISEDVVLEPAISPELRKIAMECVKSMSVKDSVPVSHSIIEEILQKQIVSLDMFNLHAVDDYTYAHSVNVAVLSCVLGTGMKLSDQELADLVNAAILHDFGKMKIPMEILNKKERLTGEEYDIMRSHVKLSYEMIKDKTIITPSVKQEVLFHHENEDGSGYPNGIYGTELPLIAKILHVADVYDALVSDRPFKKGYTHWEAAEYLMGGCGISFDKEVVDCFIKLIPLYPKGSEIRLSNGNVCLVLDNTGVHNLRPVVRRIADGQTIDLSERENLSLTIHSTDDGYLAKNEASRQEMLTAAVRKKIMVVDDMKSNLRTIRDILEQEYKLVLLKSGQQALTYLSKSKAPDLIIMDIDMPEMKGTEVAKLINEKYDYQIPILFVSALSDVETVLTCRQLKAAGYIVRPYQPFYVLSEVRRILEGQEAY